MIELVNLTKTFSNAGGTLDALKDISLTIEDGDIYGIIGMSGAGKSTLVRCINMLERPTEGTVLIDGVDISKLSPKELRELRRGVTMIFQGFNLLMQRNCLENVTFPLELAGIKGSEAKKRALELLDIVGLKEKAKSYPAQLSGGQQQRVAIARALATNPKVLLCDEATSALDPTTTNSILELIREINQKTGITVIVITHQMSVVESICKHVAILDLGTVAEIGDVQEVFAHPKSDAARRLVFPDGDESSLSSADSGELYLRVVFNGASSTGKPLIATMAADEGLMANIAFASTKLIGGKVYGSMILGFENSEKLAAALSYLNKQEDVHAEEVKRNV